MLAASARPPHLDKQLLPDRGEGRCKQRRCPNSNSSPFQWVQGKAWWLDHGCWKLLELRPCPYRIRFLFSILSCFHAHPWAQGCATLCLFDQEINTTIIDLTQGPELPAESSTTWCHSPSVGFCWIPSATQLMPSAAAWTKYSGQGKHPLTDTYQLNSIDPTSCKPQLLSDLHNDIFHVPVDFRQLRAAHSRLC